MPKDFIDEDLLNIAKGGKSTPSDLSQSAASPISRDGLAKMAQQKSELNHQVADAVHEIEELRQRQDQLEKEKQELEDLGRRQDEYTTNKQTVIKDLSGSIILLEKEEMQAARMLELLGVIKTRFKDALAELRSITEDGWGEDAYQMELNKAIVIVEDARNTFRKGLAKMEAAGWQKSRAAAAAAPSASDVTVTMQRNGFIYWLKVGIAVSVPFIVFKVVLFLVSRYLDGYGVQ